MVAGDTAGYRQRRPDLTPVSLPPWVVLTLLRLLNQQRNRKCSKLPLATSANFGTPHVDAAVSRIRVPSTLNVSSFC